MIKDITIHGNPPVISDPVIPVIETSTEPKKPYHQKSGNWELCNMAKYLQDTRMTPAPSVDQSVRDRGQDKEDRVLLQHPQWKTYQKTLTLPSGRRCRLDFLDEDDCPVEVKGMSMASIDKFNTVEDLLHAAYKYQVEYLVQLSAYCILLKKPGRFILIAHEDMELFKEKKIDKIPEKHIKITLEYAQEIWSKFNNRDILIPGCAFCKMGQGCHVWCDDRGIPQDPNMFNKKVLFTGMGTVKGFEGLRMSFKDVV